MHTSQPAVCCIWLYNSTVLYRQGFETTSLWYGHGYSLYHINTVKCTAITIYGYGAHPYVL
jgi:hypothetical protein